uniref:leucine-rich repeat-containing protein 19-like n=1 Tax=Solea senegalensis TaxID=28829 RepID=UPI001CD8B03D|nr:leucine-rich repeat-containing protein 19-like [Solea senegalensis]
MMQRCREHLLLLCLTAAVTLNILGTTAETEDLNNKTLRAIPDKDNSSSVTRLEMKGNLITLNDPDRLALATYPNLTELLLDENCVTAVPDKFFTAVPHLRVISLSRNNISRLEPQALSGLDVLTELDLSHNLLTRLPTELFRGLKSLQVLKLQENPWNCSCSLLLSIKEVTAANISIGSPICASPQTQAGKDLLEATAACFPSSSPSPSLTFTTDPQKTPTSADSQRPEASLNTVLPSNHNEQTAVMGNSWKFITCVVALALTTALLIVCAIKGPSWYKLFHNYRHQRLGEDNEDDEDVITTGFPEMGIHFNHQTFTFKQDIWQMEGQEEEEEEEVYYEDPYIRREE